jgi:hypothetical protein
MSFQLKPHNLSVVRLAVSGTHGRDIFSVLDKIDTKGPLENLKKTRFCFRKRERSQV